MESTYLHNIMHVSMRNNQGYASPTWKRMLAVKDEMEENMCIRIRWGNTSFWFDHWDLNGLPPIPQQPIFNLILNQALNNGSWDKNLILSSCPNFNVSWLEESTLYYHTERTLAWQNSWQNSSSGNFSCSSEIFILREGGSSLFSRRMIWNNILPLKISIFMWRLLNSLLPLDDIM
ncbi:hypothetical protein ACH5RR_000849 [Cinchona calisaya]|uniref:Reverse transcriptase zinc-binding domain-containing protein n=1 Tax=Cinchona calisaya TaxID=153742 RepID=A0ABD3B2I7_9GENT